MFNIKCFFCKKEACAKIGQTQGNIFSAFFGKKCMEKREVYVCKIHYEEGRKTQKW